MNWWIYFMTFTCPVLRATNFTKSLSNSNGVDWGNSIQKVLRRRLPLWSVRHWLEVNYNFFFTHRSMRVWSCHLLSQLATVSTCPCINLPLSTLLIDRVRIKAYKSSTHLLLWLVWHRWDSEARDEYARYARLFLRLEVVDLEVSLDLLSCRTFLWDAESRPVIHIIWYVRDIHNNKVQCNRS